MTQNVVEHLHVQSAAASAVEMCLNVRDGSGAVINTIAIDGYTPRVPREGERITLSDLAGFPGGRHTVGKVRQVSHIFVGNAVTFKHTISVDIDAVL